MKIPCKLIISNSPILFRAMILSLAVLSMTQCQHARIRVSPPLPSECKPWEEKQMEESCIAKRQELKAKLESIPTSVKEYEHEYYYWGFKPADYSIQLEKECPNGVFEIHQYSTFKQGFYEQVTLGFYTPRTLQLTCLSERFNPNPEPEPRRRRR